MYVKHISGVWLLVAGRDPCVEMYSAQTLRRAKIIQTQGRVISAEGSKTYCFLGVANKDIKIYSLKSLEHIKTINILQPATAMTVLNEDVLLYGLGDEGYGCIFLSEDFRIFESSAGQERNKRQLAKPMIMPTKNQNGVIWKIGGYTSIPEDDNNTQRSSTRKKTTCYIAML